MKKFMPVTQHIRRTFDECIMAIDGSDLASKFMTDAWNGSQKAVCSSNFPGIYPPSPAFIIEVESGGDLFAVLFGVRRPEDGWFYLSQDLYAHDPFSKTTIFMGERISSISGDGSILKWGILDVTRADENVLRGWAKRMRDVTITDVSDARIVYSAISILMASCLDVLSFLGCKNITAEPVETIQNVRVPRGKNPNKFRVEQRPFRYHVLKISSPGASKESRATGSERLTAAHICRGHVKRYTAEKPLLGRHVGAFYFAQHVRGSESVGVVEKDYQVISK